MMKPTVSIWMTTYNHASYIAQAIESVLSQVVDFQIELVIGEDCSTDGTREICIHYKEKFPELINLLLPEENLGMMRNGLATLASCTGEYIAILEGDDYWSDNYKLKKQIDFMQSHPNLSFSFHGANTLDTNGKFGKYWRNPKFIDRSIIQPGHFLEYGGASFCSASAIFRANVFNNLPEWYTNAKIGDYPLMIMALDAGEIGYIADEMCVYRINSATSWSNSNKSIAVRIASHYHIIKLNKHINSLTNSRYKKYLPSSILSYLIYKIVRR